MLKFYAGLARRLQRFQWLFWLVILAAVGLLVFSFLFYDGVQDEYLTLGLLCALLWAMSTMVLVRVFVAPLPTIDPEMGFFVRLTVRIRRGARWTMAVVVTALFAIVLWITSRAIGVIT